jgi:hypothetical protein
VRPPSPSGSEIYSAAGTRCSPTSTAPTLAEGGRQPGAGSPSASPSRIARTLDLVERDRRSQAVGFGRGLVGCVGGQIPCRFWPHMGFDVHGTFVGLTAADREGQAEGGRRGRGPGDDRRRGRRCRGRRGHTGGLGGAAQGRGETRCPGGWGWFGPGQSTPARPQGEYVGRRRRGASKLKAKFGMRPGPRPMPRWCLPQPVRTDPIDLRTRRQRQVLGDGGCGRAGARSHRGSRRLCGGAGVDLRAFELYEPIILAYQI